MPYTSRMRRTMCHDMCAMFTMFAIDTIYGMRAMFTTYAIVSHVYSCTPCAVRQCGKESSRPKLGDRLFRTTLWAISCFNF